MGAQDFLFVWTYYSIMNRGHCVFLTSSYNMTARCVARAANDAGCDKLAGQTRLFGLPSGVAYFAGGICENETSVQVALGQSHAFLTVTHTRVRTPPLGLWFYHVPRDCSDLAWNVGRTLLVRNRCDLAIQLERSVHGGGDVHASVRLAAKLLAGGSQSGSPGGTSYWSKMVSTVLASKYVQAHAINGSSPTQLLAWTLRQCAHGVVQCKLPTGNSSAAAECDWACIVRSKPLTALGGSDALDHLNTALLRTEAERGRMLDTVQMFAQPQGGSSRTGVEL